MHLVDIDDGFPLSLSSQKSAGTLQLRGALGDSLELLSSGGSRRRSRSPLSRSASTSASWRRRSARRRRPRRRCSGSRRRWTRSRARVFASDAYIVSVREVQLSKKRQQFNVFFGQIQRVNSSIWVTNGLKQMLRMFSDCLGELLN